MSNGIQRKKKNFYIYITESLAAKIKKQIDTSEILRSAHNLPYIFLHQRKGRKTTMFDVQYFITKINRLVQKYNICDESGQP